MMVMRKIPPRVEEQVRLSRACVYVAHAAYFEEAIERMLQQTSRSESVFFYIPR